MTYGLISAIAWGISTVAAANAARRVGTFLAVLFSQILGVVVLVLLTALLRPPLNALGGLTALGLVGAGLLALLGWLSYYRALEFGPVSLVSAIGATYGAVTASLAVAVLGEHLGGFGSAGAALAVAGVTMVAVRSTGAGPAAAGEAAPGRGPARPGIPLAFVSALSYGVGAFLLGTYSARAGWLPSALVAYASSVIALLLALPFLARPKARPASASGLTWAAIAGLTEALALVAFARGGQVGQVAMTATVSSLYPAIPLAAGVLLFRERLNRRHLLGVGLIVTGLLMISLI